MQGWLYQSPSRPHALPNQQPLRPTHGLTEKRSSEGGDLGEIEKREYF